MEGYRYPVTPYPTQRKTSEAFVREPRLMIANSIGTGKTYAACFAMDYLFRNNVIRKVLVVAPKTTLRDVWAPHVFKTNPRLRTVVLDGPGTERKEVVRRGEWDVAIINPEGLTIIKDEVKGVPDLVIVDEFTEFKERKTAKYKALEHIAPADSERPGLWLMSGTPTPQSPTDIWAPARLVAPDKIPRYFSRFREQVCVQRSMYKWEARPDANDIIARLLKGKLLRFEGDLDLPPLTWSSLSVDQTPMQKKLLAQLRKEVGMLMESGVVTPANAADSVLKIMQVLAGAVKVSDGVYDFVDCGPRLDLLQDVIDSTDRPVIVYSRFTGGRLVVGKHLKSKGVPFVQVHGGVSQGARVDAFNDLREGRAKVLVAQPRAMRTGITLVQSNVVLWWSLDPSQYTFTQANGRIRRHGQTGNTYVITPYANFIEHRVAQTLRQRDLTGEELLSMLEQFTSL